MTDSTRGLIVVAEDEPAIADLLSLYLTREGYSVEIVADGAEALQTIQSRSPVAAILDVGLPSMAGTEVCSALRSAQNWTPVLFCTARDDEIDRVLGLELGADDYITKPFSPREVVARVKAVLRRTEGRESKADDVLAMSGVVVDTNSRRALVNETELDLTPTEFDLLAYLLRNPGRVYGRDQLLTDVWGYSSAVGSRTVDVHIAQLRSKLEPVEIIRTVRGVGYSADERPS
ncbi:MAG: response regulator transcription factor [Candidatus Nanopelagicales bacterium]